jgi:glucuronate isomerase
VKKPANPVFDPHFLLPTSTARELYEAAAAEPIYDYHCHLSPREIADDKQWADVAELWLGGDHYKWRAMRANGVAEEFVTGNAAPYDKFRAYAATMPRLLRNPIWHWTHLELSRVFQIEETLDEASAPRIWEEANARLKSISASTLLTQFRVRVVGTTDDPCDSLDDHERIRRSGLGTRVYPSFRPDKALAPHQPEVFRPWVARLAEVSGVDCGTLAGFLTAIEQRHAFFHERGSRLSDHGLNHCYGPSGTREEAEAIYLAGLRGGAIDAEKLEAYRGFLMLFFGELDAKRGWVKQLHVGAMRNVNTRQHQRLGADTGYDSIGDWPQIERMARYLDALESRDSLPKMVLYNLNPADNYALATLCGDFHAAGVRGKVQFGSGWWFLDQLEGMTWQINALSQLGLLANFVGMLTDSRSFVSYPRHEYFRRLLCRILGEEVERGLLPDDMPLLTAMVRDIAYRNAVAFFGMEPGTA